MAKSGYQVFRETYSQAIADGLGTAVATAAAQSAMSAVLTAQAASPQNAAPQVQVQSGRKIDSGPVHPVK